jgi:hypothetical protein
MSTLLPCDAVDKDYPAPMRGGFDDSNVLRNIQLAVSKRRKFRSFELTHYSPHSRIFLSHERLGQPFVVWSIRAV